MIETAADRLALLQDEAVLALFATLPTVTSEADGYPQTFPFVFGQTVDAVASIDRNVLGVFDRPYSNESGHEGYHPLFLIVDEDARYLRQGHRLMLKGHVWSIDERLSDGTGFTQLKLSHMGAYALDVDDAAVQAGYPYTLPLTFGLSAEPGARTNDPENLALAYPYTVNTYFDQTTPPVTL